MRRAKGPPGAGLEETHTSRRPARRLAFSLTARILAINVLALAILLAGFFYLGRYQSDLIDAKLGALQGEGVLIAAALGESTVIDAGRANARLDAAAAGVLIQRLPMAGDMRALLFASDGRLLVDSLRVLPARVRTEELPPPDQGGALNRLAIAAYDWVIAHLPPRTDLPRHVEPDRPAAQDYAESLRALAGERAGAVRQTAEGGLIAIVALPVQPFRRVLGVLLISASADDVARSVREVRFTVLEAFGIALAITVLLTLYFAGTITRPVKRLALAAERVCAGHGRKVEIPDFTARHDEIGRLSGALQDMTATLWARMDATERFVADVAHEIKNPLSSVRSAVETARRVSDPEQREKLLEIVVEDVNRLDRLLSEIADASRLDTELSRAQPVPVDLRAMLGTLADIHDTAGDAARQGVSVRLEVSGEGPFTVPAVEDRLAQVFQNLLSNARSFSPAGGGVVLRLAREGAGVRVDVDDEGPGVPENLREAIFRRFYTLRPEGEKFGTHSGLGLSISRQIVGALGGTIMCTAPGDGAARGARFTVRLPVSERDG